MLPEIAAPRGTSHGRRNTICDTKRQRTEAQYFQPIPVLRPTQSGCDGQEKSDGR
jgi:hypothetical protein